MHRVEDFDILADDAEGGCDALHIFFDHLVEGFGQCRLVSIKR